MERLSFLGRIPDGFFDILDVKPIPVIWSDTIFEKTYCKPFIKQCRPNKAQALIAARYMLNCYIGGDQNQVDIEICLYTLFAYWKIDNTYILNDLFIDEKETQTELPDSSKLSKLCIYKVITNGNQNEIELKNINGKILSRLTESSINQWYDKAWKLLDENNENVDYFIYSLTYSMLYCVRMCIKKPEAVYNGLWSRCGQRATKFWPESPITFNRIPPSNCFMQTMKLVFRKGHAVCTNVICVLVKAYISAHESTTSRSIKRMTEALCLLSFKEVGMAILHWSKEASITLNVDLQTYFKIVSFEGTSKSIDVVQKLIIDQKKQYSWPWAKLITEFAIAPLALKDHQLLSLIGVKIATKCNMLHPHWKSPSILPFVDSLMCKRADLCARHIFKKLNIKIIDSPFSTSAQ